MLDSRYRVTSNRESGSGRYDIQLFPLKQNLPGILIELKSAKNCTEEQLAAFADGALRQIEEKQYHTELVSQGITKVLKYGIAFSGKQVCVKGD